MNDAPQPRRPDRSVYPVRRGYFARALGRAAIAAAVGVLAVTLCLTLSAPGLLTSFFVVLSTGALVVVAFVAVSVVLPPTMLQLDRQGFRASKRYTAGPRHASWFEVTNAASQQGPDGWVLLIQHEGGEHTAVPLTTIDADPVEVEKDVRERLNEAHGYGPLPS